MKNKFIIKSKYKPCGDQQQAIEKICEGLDDGLRNQVLLGVTGSGKTFTMANCIEKMNRPTLVIAHNKTLAAQLCNEFRELFPDNRVEYFVSYYDYYRPEAYIPGKDVYIEKETDTNDEIDKLRHSATSSLGERRDVIVVASVSCIYGLGAPSEYFENSLSLRPGQIMDRDKLIDQLIKLQYKRSDFDFVRSTFRVRGDIVEIFPSNSTNIAYKIDFFGDEIESIQEEDVLTGKIISRLEHAPVFPATHYVIGDDDMEKVLNTIKEDLRIECEDLRNAGKLIEEQRLRERVTFDIEMIREIGYCSGIENYSRYFDGRKVGEPPFTLMDYFPKDFLLFIDESHMTLPQIRAMYAGDRSRKTNLIEYGFRLKSAFDNRPLKFEEFKDRYSQAVFVSATPGPFELENSENVVEQLLRPTGLLEPPVEVRPIATQIDDLLAEIRETIKKKGRILITTLTKKMAESLTDYLVDHNIKAVYMHSDTDTLERIEIINGLRKGKNDVLVGINLLREGLDIPEVMLVAILDADKEGFLRSRTSFIQTIGRAARNSESKVILYADNITGSMKFAMDETKRRREFQMEYNKKHNITPKTIIKDIKNSLNITKKVDAKEKKKLTKKEVYKEIDRLKGMMTTASKALDFESCIVIRDQIAELKRLMEGIVVRGAREHNLKNIDVTIPRDKLVVFTGVSGSGKSSLAFDTIFAEGQRRYVESLSSYARQFLGQMDKPDVESIDGLSPAISIDQKTTSKNPRSTVGTVTEIYDYLRLLFARIGVPHCPVCGKEISKVTVDQIVDKIKTNKERTKFIILAPIVRGRKGEYKKQLESLRRSGYARVKIDGIIYRLDEEINLDKNIKHDISVVVDRLIMKDDIDRRLTDSVENALKLADGLVAIEIDSKEELFSTNYACADCGITIGEITPRMFSFNSPFGACENCHGLGFSQEIDLDKLIPDKTKSLRQGAVKCSGWNLDMGKMSQMQFSALSKRYNFSMDTPFEKLSKEIQNIILYGNGGEELKMQSSSARFQVTYNSSYEGIVNNLNRRYNQTQSEGVKREIEKLMTSKPCEVCHGQRLKKEVLYITIGGRNISQVCDIPICRLPQYFDSLKLTKRNKIIAKPIMKELNERVKFLNDVGLGYLTLSRASGSLSGGEAQRIRLATQIGSGLMGVLYILDEPSIGLHQRDNAKLIKTLKRLRDLGNTLIVVEHDEETIREADFIVDIGRNAGINGGDLVALGTQKDIMDNPNSLTGDFLSGREKIEIPEKRRKPNGKFLEIIGASYHNLKNINVDIPIGLLTVISGVSGSGKSSLVNGIIYPYIYNYLNKSNKKVGDFKEIRGIEYFDKIINIDQSPIGRTPRSNPATYVGFFTEIRKLFASTQDAKARGYEMGRFSFNKKGGRCENCQGDGIIKIEMHFLSDVYVPCEVCHGKRYNRETLEVKYKGKSIFDVLEMTIDEACSFFENIPKIYRHLKVMQDVGLGYIKLGQPATTFSGGEAQRIKLATELSKRSTGRTLYILDEPTTGLHPYDVKKLTNILNRLVGNGNTVVVIEHNLDVIKIADHIIDLGKEGGDAGGELLVCGSPEEVAKCKDSYTAKYLDLILNNNI